MAFKIKDGVRIGTVDVFNNSGELLVNAPNVTGTVATANGGTGQTTYSDGQLLIGNSTGGLTKATLTAGSNISITNGNGSITITANASGDKATSTALGTVKLGSDTVQTTAANAITTTASRTYAVQFNSSDQMVVNVPWVDTNTTYTAGAGLSLAGTQFSHADTSSVSNLSSDNSNGTVIQDVSLTFDTYGHVTGATVGTVNLDDRYYTETESDNRFVNVSGDTMTGFLTLHADPSSALHAATKQYVDTVAEGLRTKPAVEIATTANLTATYSNGTSGVGATLTATSNGAFPTIDGITLSSTAFGENGVLVKNQTNAAHNGRYNLTQVGDAGTPWILTRCGLCDEADEIPGSYVFVKRGTLYAGTGWVQTVANPTTFVVGTDAITVSQFSGAGTYTAGAGLTLTGTTFAHADTSSQASVDNSGNTFIQDIALDTYGHITSITSAAVSIGDGTLSIATKTAGSTGTDVTLNLSGAYSANTTTNRTINAVVGPALTALASTMTGAGSGFLRKNGADTFSIDTNTYLTSQSNDFGTFAINGTDSGYTWGTANTNTNQVADTTGDTLTLVKGGGINLYTNTVAGTDAIKIEHADTSSVANLSSDNSGNTFIQDISFTFDTYGHVTGATVATGTASFTESDTLATVTGRGDTTTTKSKFNGGLEVTTLDRKVDASTFITGEAVTNNTIATTSATAVDSFSATTFRSAKFLVQVTQGSAYQVSEVLVIHNGSSTVMTEYAALETGSPLCTITSDISGGNVRLLVAMGTSTSANVKVVRTAIRV